MFAPVFTTVAYAEADRAAKAMEKNDRGDGNFLTLEEFSARFGGQNQEVAQRNKKKKRGKGKKKKSGASNDSPPDTAKSTPEATAALVAAPAGKSDLYFIDAHSQWDHRVDEERVLSLMNHGGIYRTLLSVHLKRSWKDVVVFGEMATDRIIPTVHIKGKGYHKGPPKAFHSRLKGQMGSDAFRAMAEILMWHDGAGKYQEIRIGFDDKLFLAAFTEARANNWPLIVHIEFASLSENGKREYMEKLETFLSANRDVSVVMIHMAQLEEPDVRRLLTAHPNLHFMTSHASPFYRRTGRGGGGKPFISMVYEGKFSPQWKKLIIEYPDRFVFALDNVFSKFWMPDNYLEKMKMWWSVVADLPADVAKAFAHGNAERLWKLAPKSDGGMMALDEAMKELGPPTGYSAGMDAR